MNGISELSDDSLREKYKESALIYADCQRKKNRITGILFLYGVIAILLPVIFIAETLINQRDYLVLTLLISGVVCVLLAMKREKLEAAEREYRLKNLSELSFEMSKRKLM